MEEISLESFYLLSTFYGKLVHKIVKLRSKWIYFFDEKKIIYFENKKMSEDGGSNNNDNNLLNNGNSAFDWEIFDVLCRDVNLDPIEVSNNWWKFFLSMNALQRLMRIA